MRTQVRVAGFFLVASVVGAPCSGQDRTPREIVETILADGPRARAIRAAADTARSEQAARLAYPNPSLMYSREGAGFAEFFQVEQALPIFGTRAAWQRAGLSAIAAAEAERDALLWALRGEALAGVMRLVAQQQRLESVRASIAEIRRVVEVLIVREKEGEGSRFDRLRAEHELIDARQAELLTEVAVADARAAVAAMMPPGSRPAVAPDPSKGSPPPTVDALLSRLTVTRPELRALQLSMQRFSLEATAARRARLPGPVVTAGLKRGDTGGHRENGGTLGIALAVPLFDTGNLEAARWQGERARIETQAAALESEIRAEVTRASEVLSLRRAAASLIAVNAPEALELVKIAEVAYREGQTGILELLDAHRAASRSRLQAIELQLEVRLAEIALERAVGETLWP